MEILKISTGTAQRKSLFIFEILVIFLFMPLFFSLFKKIPPLFLIIIGGFYALWLLKKDENFDKRSFYKLPDSKNEYKRVLIQAIFFSIFLYVIVSYFLPDRAFYFLKKDFSLWLSIIMIYGLFAVYPQEILYRAFIFHRYGSIVKNRMMLIHLSAILFAFGHILYLNPITLILSLFGGYLFSYTYAKSGSMVLVSIEHFLYGFLLYTIGLGEYFCQSQLKFPT